MERDKELEMLVTMMLAYVRSKCCKGHAYERLMEAMETCIEIGIAETRIQEVYERETTKETIQ